MKPFKSLIIAAALFGGVQIASAAGTPKADSYEDPSALKSGTTHSVPNKSQEACMKEGRTGADLDICTKTPQEPTYAGDKGSQKTSGSNHDPAK